MSALVWMPFYIGDYRRDTPHLSAAQHGAYLLLIFYYWQQGSLPDDDEQLARIASMTPAEWKKNRPVIRAFFKDGWRHDRINVEIQNAVEQYEKRSKAGIKGNEKRWGTYRNAIAMGSQSQSPSPKYPSQEEDNLTGSRAGERTRPALAVVNGREDGQ